MGIRTPVASVRGSHDWPDYTIAAQLLNNLGDIFTYSLLRLLEHPLSLICGLFLEICAITTGISVPVIFFINVTICQNFPAPLNGKSKKENFPTTTISCTCCD